MTKYFLSLILVLIFNGTKAQTSFHKEVSSIRYVGFYEISINEFEEVGLLYPSIDGVNLVSIDSLQNSFFITFDSFGTPGVFTDYQLFEKDHVFTYSFGIPNQVDVTCLCKMNFDSNSSWCRKTGGKESSLIRTFLEVASDSSIYSNLYILDNDRLRSIPITKFNFDGSINWAYNYFPSSFNNHHSLIFRNIVELNDNEILVGAAFNWVVNGSPNGRQRNSFLKLSDKGEIIDNIVLQQPSNTNGDTVYFYRTNIEKDTFGNLYFPGFIVNSSNTSFKNDREAVILRLDSDFNFVWGKRLSVEEFENDNLKIKAFPNGEVLFIINSKKDLPVISGKLDDNGNLLWNRGYEFKTPEVEIGQDESLYFASAKKYYPDGTWEFANMVSKTKPDGTIDGCPQFVACVTVHDIGEVFFEKWEWERDTAPSFRFLNFSIDTLNVSLEDHCGTPRPPTPYFVTPDTICQNECLRPDSLYNHLAHAVEWTITGNGVLFENKDTSFNYCFNQPGKYQIEQEVWLLGCSEFFTRELVVLPDSLGDLLSEDRMICEDSIATLSVDASRPIRNFQWNDGSNSNALTISESGNYAVTVSDGFCTESDAIEITFFNEKYNGTILEVPTDSSICEELLPITITPQSDFSNEFLLNGNADARSSFEINRAGSYQISTKIEACEFSKTFNLSLVPCEVDIYIPSSFSPNNDGINDLLAPLGKDFMGQKLQVFDRWGGLLFETKEAPFAWNGNEVEEGVYVVTFFYLNLKNQQKEVISADVLVVR